MQGISGISHKSCRFIVVHQDKKHDSVLFSRHHSAITVWYEMTSESVFCDGWCNCVHPNNVRMQDFQIVCHHRNIHFSLSPRCMGGMSGWGVVLPSARRGGDAPHPACYER